METLIIAIIGLLFVVPPILLMMTKKTVREQKEEYIEKHGYPEETVHFGDSEGNLGCIIGRRVIRDTLNHPTMKRISKEIYEKGGSCPSMWEYEDNRKQ